MINKIKSNTFIKSTIILLFGGILSKIIGFLLRIIITRNLGTEGMGLYSMLSPTNALITTLAIFSYPSAISTIVSQNKYRNKTILSSLIPISLIINTILIIIILIFSKYYVSVLLKENILYFPIISIALCIPSITISSIMKGYYWGKQNMFPYMLSNTIEQITRFILIILFINKFNTFESKISFIILINIIGEISSQIVMYLYYPKVKINFKDLKINFNCIKDTFKITIPMTISKLIGSFSYFLEPIILTNILLYVGYSKSYINYEYGIVNAYSLSLLLMPQFFTQNMSTSLIPELSKYYSLKDYKMCIKRIKQIIIISASIGMISTIIISLFPNIFLKLLYNTTEGIDYIRILSPFVVLFYIEYPLSQSLQAINKSKKSMKITLITSIIRLLSLIIFSLLKIGMYSLIITIISNLILSTYLYYKEIKKTLII